MKKVDVFTSLYKSMQTVFTLNELSLKFREIKYVNLKRRINNLVLTDKLLSPVRGVFAKEGYSVMELACRVYAPSYISLETVLAQEGVIFQKYNSVFAISYVSRELDVDGKKIVYRRLRNEILLNNFGVVLQNNYFVATKERAFTDAVYLYRNYHFDNLGGLDWDVVIELAKIYKSKVMIKRVDSYYKLYKNEHV